VKRTRNLARSASVSKTVPLRSRPLPDVWRIGALRNALALALFSACGGLAMSHGTSNNDAGGTYGSSAVGLAAAASNASGNIALPIATDGAVGAGGADDASADAVGEAGEEFAPVPESLFCAYADATPTCAAVVGFEDSAPEPLVFGCVYTECTDAGTCLLCTCNDAGQWSCGPPPPCECGSPR
jgi:hypothetical protein